MAVNINVPSQVKTYANLAAFPATGALKTIYIAEDTNKTYRWTGSVYTEISASAAMTWGAIGGTLSNQTDLQSALDAKVPTTRTLTINGVTQDLSANRTFTISTGITIGSTAITSGVVGRVLFEGAGNVVQESSSLFWDNTNVRLGVGTSSPTQPIDVNGNGRIQGQLTTGGGSPLVLTGESFAFQTVVASGAGGSVFGTNAFSPSFIDILSGNNFWHISNRSSIGSNRLGFFNAIFSGTTATYSNELFTIHTSGNVGINTTTDSGFRLDVNGTARVKTDLKIETATGGLTIEGDASGYPTLKINTLRSGTTRRNWMFATEQFNGGDFILYRSATAGGVANTLVYSIFNDGNFGLNTSTNAGFRLDVNGTARVQGQLTLSNSTFPQLNISGTANNAGIFLNRASTSFASQIRFQTAGSDIWTWQLQGNSTNNLSAVYFSGSWIEAFTLSYTNGNVGINSSTPNLSAQLDVASTTRGFLPPRMTTTQKNAIASPAAGLMVYDTTLNVISYYNGTMWI